MKKCEYPDVEDCLLKWIMQCRSQNIPIGGHILREKAEDFGKQLGLLNFKASSGWFENFKKRHNITFHKVCGESASVDKEVCDEWIKTLPSIIKEYEANDIFNADETALFFKCLPDKTMAMKGEACYGGKQSKERVTLLLCANMDGSEKLKPLMIGKSKKPRCFTGVKSFPLDYEANKKAWMTGELFEKWLKNFDRKMTREKRKVLLFIDNCTAHPVEATRNLKSVKVEFLPPNTTSKLQPLDQGIIQSFKVKYRHEVVKKCIFDIDNGDKPSVDVMKAMRMVDKAWSLVQMKTIEKCFKKAGFKNEEIQNKDVDDAEEICEEWSELAKTMQVDGVSFKDFVEVDHHALICGQLTDSEIIAEVKSLSDEDNEDDDEEDAAAKEDGPKMTYKEALSSINSIRKFIERLPEIQTETFRAITHLENVIEAGKIRNGHQSVLENYFKCK